MRQLSTAVQLLAREIQHIRENDAHEREKMALRLENTLLKFEKRLVPPGPKRRSDTSLIYQMPMAKCGIDDLRLFAENDLRFLRQF